MFLFLCVVRMKASKVGWQHSCKMNGIGRQALVWLWYRLGTRCIAVMHCIWEQLIIKMRSWLKMLSCHYG